MKHVISLSHDFPSLERFFFLRFNLRLLIKISAMQKLLINYSYINIRPRFFEIRLTLQQISLNLNICSRNEGNFRDKKIIFQ